MSHFILRTDGSAHSRMTVAEMCDLQELMGAFGAERGVLGNCNGN